MQQTKNEAIAEWKTVIAEKTQRLVCIYSYFVQATFIVNLVAERRAVGRPESEWVVLICQAQVKVDVSNLKEDIGKLKSQIVESPEELKSQLEKMRENIKTSKMSIVSFKKQLREKSNVSEMVTTYKCNPSWGLQVWNKFWWC